jgi:hypothetical protein
MAKRIPPLTFVTQSLPPPSLTPGHPFGVESSTRAWSGAAISGVLVVAELAVGDCPVAAKKPAPLGAGSSLRAGLLRRRDRSDGLQAEGNDLGADHFARDDQLHAAILLTALGCIV